jgi:hypothetical protein
LLQKLFERATNGAIILPLAICKLVSKFSPTFMMVWLAKFTKWYSILCIRLLYRKQLKRHYTDRNQVVRPGEMTPDEFRENEKRKYSSARQSRLLLPVFDEEHNRARAAVGLPPVS